MTEFPTWQPGEQLEGLPAAQAPAAPVGLRAALELGIVASVPSLEALRKASQRPEFPAPVAQGIRGEQLYSPGDLERWERNRPRRPMASGE